MHSQAKVVEVDIKWEGPCRRESKVQVFSADFGHHYKCMQHCQKIVGGRSPPVNTKEDWETLKMEVDLITQDRSGFPYMWLSATEGDEDGKRLARLGHWPKTEVVKNETKKLEAIETIWRDFFSGQRLDNWTKPYYGSREDTKFGDNYNCMMALTDVSWHKSWYEWQCTLVGSSSCPCSYPAQPLLWLRGLCSSIRLIYPLFSPKQLPGDPGNMILMGPVTTRIEYNDTSSQWVLTRAGK